MRTLLFIICLIYGFQVPKNVFASCNNPIHGINLVPMPSAFYQGSPDMQFPDVSQINYYKSVGLNAIRLPIEWEKIQPSLKGDLNKRYLNKIITFLDLAGAAKMRVVIDLHNYARYKGVLLGSGDVTSEAFYDVWHKIALALHAHPAVFAYGLMNEPHDTNGIWHKYAQFGLNGVRSIDKEKFIYIAGDSWSSAERWKKVNTKPFISDPSHRSVYEAHVYFDDDASGRYAASFNTINMKNRVESRVYPFLNWIKEEKQKGVIGEFGVPMTDPRWLTALSQFIEITAASCTDWFIWAGGPWRQSYELSLEPISGEDRPQIRLIRKKLSK